jgi:hypothetical protein
MTARYADWLTYARDRAEQIAREKGTVCADDLRRAGVYLPNGAHPAAWGAVFRDPRFLRVGFTTSQRRDRHGGTQRVWRLRP